ncbi:NACHT domain-containing NTPase [Oculatella sp. FACHB-28]|uniref:NACHT domain-containing protein n=1 Tax=Oculatella sp. FACHB-28 TaxID=2692845 RepID=UPI001687C5D8|nr:NACHT domain-containing NTPase [Oculatella sp. FACHB-28]MBD2054798.1 NACHT domain-containing NTPase [Oculatella sp. FACHB-28]
MTERAKRSVAATLEGLKQIEEKRRISGRTAQEIADFAGVSRSLAQKFFGGKALSVSNFQKLCEQLGLNWEEIGGLERSNADKPPQLSETTLTSSELDLLVQQAREQGRTDIDKRCGWMKVLDMQQRIDMGVIYTDVNILEKITGRTRRELNELMQGCTPENFDRFLLGQVREQRVDGLEAVQQQKQLMILGRPGAGKTTFLKRLAILCNQGTFLAGQVPMFVTLKEFAETINQPALLNFIAHYFAPKLPMDEVDRLLYQGRALVLLDGLDEVPEKDHDRILRDIREFTERYEASYIVITCRIAAREYVFQQFTDVEMADFSDEQILDFADKWFKSREPDNLDKEGNSEVAKLFWEALKACEPIKELAANPLLLTLLCLEFEQSAEFPQGRAELYERALHVLLSKWDGQRRIKREEVYRRLPIKRKESMLGQLARYTFERGDYFFREHLAKQLIGQYIQNLPDARTDPETLLVDSYAVLKSVESQHGLLTERATGIYSFSHLTFHEYFTAKNILDASDPAVQQSALQKLVGHINENRWREVFLLVAERMDNAAHLLTMMKQQIDQTLAEDEKLQEFLIWIEQKARSVEAPYKPAAIRAFYFDHAIARIERLICLSNMELISNHDSNLSPTIRVDFNRECALTRNLDRDLARDLDHTFRLNRTLDFDHTFRLNRTLDFDLNHILNSPRSLALDLDLDHTLDRTLDRLLAHNSVLAHTDISDRDDEPDLPIDRDLAYNYPRHLALTLTLALALTSNQKLQRKLRELQKQLPKASNRSWKQLNQWRQTKGQNWTEQLRKVMIEDRDIGQDWQFNDKQREQLEQYYKAHQLLITCLNSSYVERDVRQQIESELLLPVKRIQGN